MMEEEFNHTNFLAKPNKHRRTYSQNDQFTGRRSFRNGGYLFEHERKKSLKNQQNSQFQELVQRIDQKLATNRAKRRSKSRNGNGSRVLSRNY